MASTVVPGLSIEKAIKEQVDRFDKLMHEQAEREVKGTPPGTAHKFIPAGTDPGWPTQEQFAKLSKTYNPEIAKHLNRPGRALDRLNKTQGASSALRKMCLVSMPAYKEKLRMVYGELTPEDQNYSHEQLEREHGFAPQGVLEQRALKSLTGYVTKASNMSESSGVLGGYGVPPDFRNVTLTIEEEQSVILQKCNRVPMSTKTAQFPALDITTNYGTGKSPYEAGVFQAWQPEAVTINQTNANMRQFELTNWDLVCYIVISNDLLQDNSVGLDMILQGLLATSEVFYLTYAIQNGLGSNSSMPLGILNSPATLGVDRSTSNTITVSDVTTMLASVQERSLPNVTWTAHQSTIPKLAQLVSNATTGQFAWLNPNGEGTDGPLARPMPMKMFGGGELHFTQTCQQLGSTGDLRAVDYGQYYLGERMGQQIAVSDQFLFTNNQIVIRSVTRVGGSLWLPNVISDAQGYTVSPSVILDVHT